WRKQVGQRAEKDENLVEIESDKATVELPAPVSGTITQILQQPGQRAQVGEVIGHIAAGGDDTQAPTSPPASASPPMPGASPKSPEVARRPVVEPRIIPAAQRVMAQEGIRPEAITPTGPGGRVLKEDVERAAENRVKSPESKPSAPVTGEIVEADLSRTKTNAELTGTGYPREEEFVVMSPIRQRIAERLVEAQRNAALLTTFNEVDMGAVIELRSKHREQYQEHYGVKLGFMSF